MTFVQAWRNDGAASANSIAVTINPSAGRTLIVYVAFESAVDDAITINDGGSTWTVRVDYVNATDVLKFEIQTAQGVASGSRSLTASWTTARPNRSIRVEEHSGLSTYINATVVNRQLSPGTAAGAVTSGNINVTSQPAWLIGCSLDWGNGVASDLTAANGNNNGTGFDYGGADYGRFSDRRVTATGNQALTFTTASNSLHHTAALAFTEAASGPDVRDISGSTTVTFTTSGNLTRAGSMSGSSSLSFVASARIKGVASISSARGVGDGSVYFGESTPEDFDFGELTEILIGDDEFTVELWLLLDDSFPVGPTTNDTPGQLENWAQEDVTRYSEVGWWYKGNFAIDMANNTTLPNGTFMLQFYGGGRPRWCIGDGASSAARTGGVHGIQPTPTNSIASLLDGRWHKYTMIRRANDAGSTFELWVDGNLVATETSATRPNLRTAYWTSFAGWPEPGMIFGAEKQAAYGNAGVTQYEDAKMWMADLAFLNRARSSTEIQQGWRRRTRANDDGVVQFFPFDDLSGTEVEEANGGDSITLIGGPQWSSERVEEFEYPGLRFEASGNLDVAQDEDAAGTTSLTFSTSARLSAYVNARATGAFAFAASANLGAYRLATGNASLSLSASAVLGAYRNAVGSSSLSFATSARASYYAALAGATSLSFNSSSRLNAYANARASTSFTFSVSGSVSVDGTLSGTATLSFTTAGNLKARASISGSSTISFTASGFVGTGPTDISGSTSLSFAANGRIAGLRNAVGSTSISFSASASIGAHANCVANVELSFSVSGRLLAYASLAGSTALTFTVQGALANPFTEGALIYGIEFERRIYKIVQVKRSYTV